MSEWIYEFYFRAKLGSKFVENLDSEIAGHSTTLLNVKL